MEVKITLTDEELNQLINETDYEYMDFRSWEILCFRIKRQISMQVKIEKNMRTEYYKDGVYWKSREVFDGYVIEEDDDWEFYKDGAYWKKREQW